MTHPLMSTRELADSLSCHPETVRRMVRRGTIPVAGRLGRDWRFDRAAVIDALTPTPTGSR